MRKITRKSLDELAQEMPVISEIEQRSIVGGDDYQLTEWGTIKLLRRTEEEDDSLLVFDKEGNYKTGIDITKGVLSGMGGNNATSKIMGSGAARSLYQFCANNSSVEWCFVADKNGNAFVSTNGNPNSVNPPGLIARDNIAEISHSHLSIATGNANGSPGADDINMANSFGSGSAVNFSIYYNGGYIYYDGSGNTW